MSSQHSSLCYAFWQAQDIKACAELAKRTSADAGWSLSDYQSSFDQGDLGLVARQISSQDSVGCFVGCLVGRIVIDTAELFDLQVLPELQRQGVGSDLLRGLKARCNQQQVTSIVLEVRRSNARAFKFYQRHGFKTLSKRVGYYAATEYRPREDGIIMVLKKGRLDEPF